jgi:hypothetical protein
MKEPILKFNRTLSVNDDQHGWSLREKKILEVWTNCVLEKAAAYKEAIEMMASCVYPLIILSPMVLFQFILAQSQPSVACCSVLIGALVGVPWMLSSLHRKHRGSLFSQYGGMFGFTNACEQSESNLLFWLTFSGQK